MTHRFYLYYKVLDKKCILRHSLIHCLYPHMEFHHYINLRLTFFPRSFLFFILFYFNNLLCFLFSSCSFFFSFKIFCCSFNSNIDFAGVLVISKVGILALGLRFEIGLTATGKAGSFAC